MAVHPESREAVFAASVRARRESRKWTQTDLARKMHERGFSFHQQTIQRIEDAARPVRLDEAYALADLLEDNLDMMSRSREGMRRHEVIEARYGSLEITTAVYRAWERWCEEARAMASHVGYQLDSDRRTDRAYAGLAILERMIEWRPRIFAAAEELVDVFASEAFLDATTAGGDSPSDGETEVSEAEQDIVDVLEKYDIPERFRKMSIDELGDLYYVGGDDGEH